VQSRRSLRQLLRQGLEALALLGCRSPAELGTGHVARI
jgi:hypothetical protein